MTHDEISAMEPGRELNVAVGINVFGKSGLELMGEFLPDYSRSLTAAWELVEEARGREQNGAFISNVCLAICKVALMAVTEEENA
jgi:hypothetical protein